MEKDVTRSIEEQLSAFLDGELPEAELQLLVRRLERDEALRATLARYAAVGSVLRQEPIHVSGDDLRQRLLVTIESEQPVEIDSEAPAKIQTGNGLRTLLAAGIAALAVLGFYMGNFGDQGVAGFDAGETVELTATANPASDAAGAKLPVAPYAQPSAGQASINPDRMTSYLVSHGEYSRSFQGTIVDSRIFVQQASFER